MPVTADQIKSWTVAAIAREIVNDWQRVTHSAVPYLSAMQEMDYVNPAGHVIGADDSQAVIAYFISNSSQWRGDTARTIKAELKRRLQMKV